MKKILTLSIEKESENNERIKNKNLLTNQVEHMNISTKLVFISENLQGSNALEGDAHKQQRRKQ
jgi:hypothetical protein